METTIGQKLWKLCFRFDIKFGKDENLKRDKIWKDYLIFEKISRILMLILRDILRRKSTTIYKMKINFLIQILVANLEWNDGLREPSYYSSPFYSNNKLNYSLTKKSHAKVVFSQYFLM